MHKAQDITEQDNFHESLQSVKEEPLSPPLSREPESFEESLDLLHQLEKSHSATEQMAIKPIKHRLLKSLDKLPANNNESTEISTNSFFKKRKPNDNRKVLNRQDSSDSDTPNIRNDIARYVVMTPTQRKNSKIKSNCKSYRS